MDRPFRFFLCPPLRSLVPRQSSPIAGAAGFVPRQAPLAIRTFQNVQNGRANAAAYEFDIGDFFRSDGARTKSRCSVRTVSSGSPASMNSATPRAGDDGRAAGTSPTCSSPKTTGCRFSTAGWCGKISEPAPSCNRPPASPSPDVDGNTFYDLTGSYGVNIFGNDFYKECITELKSAPMRSACARPYHPVITTIAATVRDSGSMKSRSTCPHRSRHAGGSAGAYHTKRSHLVRFAGAYHGWWGDVQPGVGNPVRRTRPIRWPTCRSGC